MEGYPQTENTHEKIEKYQEAHIPPALRSQKKVNMLLAAGFEQLYTKDAHIEGLELLPKEGPFIILSNHFNLQETFVLLALLKNYDAHVVAAEKIHGEHPMRSIVLKMLRGITSPASLENLSSEEKRVLLERIPDAFIKEKYSEIIAAELNDERGVSGLRKFVHSSTALLTRGDVLIIYPEGLFLYDGEDGTPRSQGLYKGYGGFELIARQYKKVTGKTLPLIPTAVFLDEDGTRNVRISPQLTLDDIGEADPVEKCMQEIAELLPESQRGIYQIP